MKKIQHAKKRALFSFFFIYKKTKYLGFGQFLKFYFLKVFQVLKKK